MTILNDKAGGWLETSLDLSTRRQRLLSSNIANVDTPGYQPQDLDFHDYLRRNIGRSEESGVEPEAQLRGGVQPNLDQSAVDLDHEVVLMTANRLFLELSTEVVSRRLGLLRYAIDEGGR